MIMITIYPADDVDASIHAEVAALAQTIHTRLYGRYQIHITLSHQYAVIAATKRSDDGAYEVLISDIPLEEHPLDIHIKRKGDLWNSLSREIASIPSGFQLQILSRRQCKMTIHHRASSYQLSYPSAYMLMHFVHVSLGMLNTVRDCDGERQMTLQTTKYMNVDTNQLSDYFVFESEPYNLSGNGHYNSPTKSKNPLVLQILIPAWRIACMAKLIVAQAI